MRASEAFTIILLVAGTSVGLAGAIMDKARVRDALKDVVVSSITADDVHRKAGVPGLLINIGSMGEQTLLACPNAIPPYLTPVERAGFTGLTDREMSFATPICDRVRAVAA